MNLPGGPELIIILLVALLVLGPQRLPEAARKAGQAMREVRKLTSGVEKEMRGLMDEPKPATKPQSRGGPRTQPRREVDRKPTSTGAASAEVVPPAAFDEAVRNPNYDGEAIGNDGGVVPPEADK